MKTLIEIAKENGADTDRNHYSFEFTPAQLQATFDDYCKQFEPIYQIIYSDGLIQDVTKIHYDAITTNAIKRIVYPQPQQIPSEVKQLEPVLTSTNYGVTMQDRNFSASGDAIYDNNFDYDARLTVSGDFADGIKEEYAKMIASVLNDHKKPIPSEVKNTLEEIMYAMRTKAANNIVIKDTTLESFADEIEKALASKPAILKD